MKYKKAGAVSGLLGRFGLKNTAEAKHEEVTACIRHHTRHKPNPTFLMEVLPGITELRIYSVLTEENMIIFTSGLSFSPMNVDEGSEDLKFADLCIYLPRDWPINPPPESKKFWPYQWLLNMAGYVCEQNSWLGGPFATFNNGNPPEPLFEGVEFTAFLLAYGFGFPPFDADDGRRVNIITCTGIYPEESKLAQDAGFRELLSKFESKGITAMTLLQRPNAAL